MIRRLLKRGREIYWCVLIVDYSSKRRRFVTSRWYWGRKRRSHRRRSPKFLSIRISLCPPHPTKSKSLLELTEQQSALRCSWMASGFLVAWLMRVRWWFWFWYKIWLNMEWNLILEEAKFSKVAMDQVALLVVWCAASCNGTFRWGRRIWFPSNFHGHPSDRRFSNKLRSRDCTRLSWTHTLEWTKEFHPVFGHLWTKYEYVHVPKLVCCLEREPAKIPHHMCQNGKTRVVVEMEGTKGLAVHNSNSAVMILFLM